MIDTPSLEFDRLRDVVRLLQCVACGGAVALDGAQVTCPSCGHHLPIVDGILHVRLADEDPALERERRAVRELESAAAVLPPGSTEFSQPALLSGPGPLRDAVLSLPDDNGSAFFRDNEYFRNVAGFAARFRAVVAALDLPAGSRVLDVGADLTWSTARLAQHGWRAVGIDINHHLAASRVFHAQGIDYAVVNMDMHAPGFAAGVFDGIVAVNALHHTHRLAPLVANLARMLRPGGRLGFIEPYWFHEDNRRTFGVAQIDAGINENVYRLEEWHQTFVTHGLELVSFTADAAFLGVYQKRRAASPRQITVDQARDELFDPFYHGRLEAAEPRTITGTAGSTLAVPVTVHNDSPRVWCQHSQVPVHLSYHVYVAAGRPGMARQLVRFDNPRTGLHQYLHPGQHDTIALHVVAPETPGRYEIDVDLVHEGITWFSARGMVPLTFEISVTAAGSAR